MRTIWKFRSFFWRYRWHYAAGLTALLFTNALMVAIPRLMKFGIDSLSGGQASRSFIAWLAVIIIGVAVVQAIVRVQSRIYLLGISRRVEVDLQNAMFARLQRLPPSFYQRMNTGDLMSRLINDVRSMRAFAGPVSMYLVNALFLYALSFASMASLDMTLTLWVLAPFPLIVYAVKRLVGPIYALSLREQEQLGKISDHVQENLTGMQVVQSQSLGKFHTQKFQDLCDEYFRREWALALKFGLMHPALQSVHALAVLVVLWKGGERLLNGQITRGDFTAFYAYLAILIGASIAMGWILNIVQRAASSSERLDEIMSAPMLSEAGGDAARRAEKWNSRGDMEVRSFSYRYAGAPEDSLKDLSFRLAGGATLGVVGRVGCGKSTLLKAFLRLVETPPGSVFIGGEDITALPLHALRRRIGYVPQDSFLFSMAVRENVAFGKPEAGMPEVEASSRRARFHDDVLLFPERYETLVGERGITLSGGQRQRGTLARSLIVEPDILILDDAFSSVDTETEAAILREIREARKGRTTLIAAQRLSALQHADWIIVLEHGRLVEEGRHEDLMRRKGLYASLYERQHIQDELEHIA